MMMKHDTRAARILSEARQTVERLRAEEANSQHAENSPEPDWNHGSSSAVTEDWRHAPRYEEPVRRERGLDTAPAPPDASVRALLAEEREFNVHLMAEVMAETLAKAADEVAQVRRELERQDARHAVELAECRVATAELRAELAQSQAARGLAALAPKTIN